MKVKALLLTLVAATFCLANANAADGLFSYDRAAVETQMSGLTKVEGYVSSNKGVTLDELQSRNSDIISGVNLDANASSFSSLAEGPAGIPSFLWGCILGVVGILIVYLITQDSEETKKALFGCLAWVGVWILWVVFWVLIFGNAFLFF